jgi:hypothetical protein
MPPPKPFIEEWWATNRAFTLSALSDIYRWILMLTSAGLFYLALRLMRLLGVSQDRLQAFEDLDQWFTYAVLCCFAIDFALRMVTKIFRRE